MRTLPTISHARLLAEVRTWGIRYLTGAIPHATQLAAHQTPLPAAELLRGLAGTDDPRLRDALIALFLLNPELAESFDEAQTRSSPRNAERLITLALATVYVQRQWYWLLSLAMGRAPTFAEPAFAPYWHQRHLPPPDVDFGQAGLTALSQFEQQRTRQQLDWQGDWQNQVAQLLAQLWFTPGATMLNFPTALAPPWLYPEEAPSMSMRPDVTRADIERFLQELGRAVHHSGKIYLAGGAALVHDGVRGAQASTADIDLKLDVSDLSEVEQALRQLKVQLGLNVELASPADFIPLPPTWEAMSRYVGRYGMLDVFYFDFYTLALAKIERGQSRDIQDVVLLQQHGLIQRDLLETAFQAILPQLGTGRFFNIDPAVFTQKFAAAIALLWGA
jgi:hypothetical protein